jgi:hypothetical protein
MQDHHQLAALLLVLAAAPAHAADKPATVTLVPQQIRQRIEVKVDGKPFTEYRYGADVKKPVLFPLRTAEGAVITRGWPLEPRPDEPTDHPHHVGYWFNYGDVAGIDFWGNSDHIKDQSHKGTIVHRKVLRAEGGQLEVRSDWVGPDRKPMILEDTLFTFSGAPARRAVDRITKLTPAAGPLELPDNKEGTLGLRLARTLEHPGDKNPGGTGHYRSSEGIEGEAVWGTRGRWLMLTARTEDGAPVTVAILDHPRNPGFPTYWHARPWGLFAANPLGQKALSKGKETLGFKLGAGGATFRYRLLILSRHATAAQIEAEYQEWIK